MPRHRLPAVVPLVVSALDGDPRQARAVEVLGEVLGTAGVSRRLSVGLRSALRGGAGRWPADRLVWTVFALRLAVESRGFVRWEDPLASLPAGLFAGAGPAPEGLLDGGVEMGVFLVAGGFSGALEELVDRAVLLHGLCVDGAPLEWAVVFADADDGDEAGAGA